MHFNWLYRQSLKQVIVTNSNCGQLFRLFQARQYYVARLDKHLVEDKPTLMFDYSLVMKRLCMYIVWSICHTCCIQLLSDLHNIHLCQNFTCEINGVLLIYGWNLYLQQVKPRIGSEQCNTYSYIFTHHLIAHSNIPSQVDNCLLDCEYHIKSTIEIYKIEYHIKKEKDMCKANRCFDE